MGVLIYAKIGLATGLDTVRPFCYHQRKTTVLLVSRYGLTPYIYPAHESEGKGVNVNQNGL